jgi:ribosomal protein L11 methyltransferase
VSSLVRVGIRVRADGAELALAGLLPILQNGAEEREVDGDVEYALYAPAGELPRVEDIRALAGDALVKVTSEPVPDGWERRWHEFLRPVEVSAGGRTLRVRPPWVAGGEDDLVVEPGVFFGAGTHATTQLCLQLLLEAEPAGALADWGAGTGVLAVAAARLGWDPVTAVEVDPGALEVIRANAAANGVRVATKWLNLAATPAPFAPAVTANLTYELHLDVAAALERPPELLIASGMLAEQAAGVAAAYARHGLSERGRRTAGEWAAVVLA